MTSTDRVRDASHKVLDSIDAVIHRQYDTTSQLMQVDEADFNKVTLSVSCFVEILMFYFIFIFF